MTEFQVGLTICAIAVAGFGVLAILGVYYDRRDWNGGVCRETGKPWKLFDRDSQGGRGYKSGDHYTWISAPLVDRNYGDLL